MKTMRLKDLCVGQSFTISKEVTSNVKFYTVVAKNDLAILCIDNLGVYRSFKNSIVVHLVFVKSCFIPYQITNDFFDYLILTGHVVYSVHYGVSSTCDEVVYI